MRKMITLLLLGLLLTSAFAQETNEADDTTPELISAENEVDETEGTGENDETTGEESETTDSGTEEEELEELESLEEEEEEVEDPDSVVEEQVSDSARLDCQLGRHTYAVERMTVHMKGIIDYVDEELELDVTVLESIKNDFYDTILDAESAETQEEFNQVLEESKELVEEFRETAAELEGFDKEAAQEYINQVLSEEKEYLEGIAAERNQACKSVALTRFDVFINNTRKVIDEMKEAGVDEQVIANLEYKLDLLIEMKDDLETALEEGDMTKYKAVENAFKDLMQQMRRRGVSARVQVRQNYGRLVSLLKTYRNIVRQAERRLESLKDTGLDVSSIQEQLDEVNDLLDQAEEALQEAKDAWQEEDYSTSKEAAERVRDLLSQAREIYNPQVRTESTRRVQVSKCGDLKQAMRDAAERMREADEIIDELLESENIDSADVRSLIADLKRMEDYILKARKVYAEDENAREACALFLRARELYKKIREQVRDYRKIAEGEEVISTSQIEEAASTSTAESGTGVSDEMKDFLKKVSQRPRSFIESCKKSPAKCREFFKNHPKVTRMLRERAPEILEEALEEGVAEEDDLAKAYKTTKERVRQKIQKRKEEIERRKDVARARIAVQKEAGGSMRRAVRANKASQAVQQKVDRLNEVDQYLTRIRNMNIRITLQCKNAVRRAVLNGVTDVDKLAEICKRGTISSERVQQEPAPTTESESTGVMPATRVR